MATTHMPQGFVTVSRALLEHPVVGLHSGHMAHWLDLILQASHKEARVERGAIRYMLGRGDLIASRRFLAHRWGISEKRVRGFLDKLQQHGMLMISTQQRARTGVQKGPAWGQRANGFLTVYTIVNYEKYQPTLGDIEPVRAQERAHTGVQKGHNYNKGKKRKKEYVDQDSGHDSGFSGPEAYPDHPLLPCIPDPVPDPVEVDRAQSAASAPSASSTPRDQPHTQDVDTAIAAWNAVAREHGLPVARVISDKRRRELRARLADAGGLQGWHDALNEVVRSDFLRGRTPSRDGRAPFKANLDFLLQPTSFARCVEGFYSSRDDGPGAPSHMRATQRQRERDMAEAWAQVRRAEGLEPRRGISD